MCSAIRWICVFALIPALVVPTYTQGRTFTKVKYMVPVGDKSKPVKARLRFSEQSVQVHNAKTGSVLKEIKYSDISGATYSMGKHPRWKEKHALQIDLGLLDDLLGLLAKSKKHWFTIQTSKKQDYMVLRLDKKNSRQVIHALESSADLEVERIWE